MVSTPVSSNFQKRALVPVPENRIRDQVVLCARQKGFTAGDGCQENFRILHETAKKFKVMGVIWRFSILQKRSILSRTRVYGRLWLEAAEATAEAPGMLGLC